MQNWNDPSEDSSSIMEIRTSENEVQDEKSEAMAEKDENGVFYSVEAGNRGIE